MEMRISSASGKRDKSNLGKEICMKIVIMLLCFFALAIIQTALRASGIVLGAIPTALLFAGAVWLANVLGKKWDENHPKQ